MKFGRQSRDLTGPENPTTSFGYRQVRAAEKEKLVHQHFDTVARKD